MAQSSSPSYVSLGAFAAAGIAVRTFRRELFYAKNLRRAVVLAALVVGLLVVAFSQRWLDALLLAQLRRQALVPALPFAALLLSDLALRQGISDRTLIHALLGPVPRWIHAAMRTLLVAAVVTAIFGAVMATLWVAANDSPGALLSDLLAVGCGALAYTGIFSALHVFTRRGFVAGLLFLVFADFMLGSMPFALRDLAPSAHVILASGRSPVGHFGQIAPLLTSTGAPAGSAFILLIIGAAGTGLASWRFQRLRVPELC